MRPIVSPDARRDLKSIARYSERGWGGERRERYMSALRTRFTGLLANPQLGSPRNDLGSGYRSQSDGISSSIVFAAKT